MTAARMIPFAFVVLYGAGLIAFIPSEPNQHKHSSIAYAESYQDVSVTVTGMMCHSCVKKVTSELKKIPGVLEPITVSHQSKKASFKLASSASLATVMKTFNAQNKTFKLHL